MKEKERKEDYIQFYVRFWKGQFLS